MKLPPSFSRRTTRIGTGENIATAVIDYLESVGVSTADTEILGADGTTVNTGHLNGSMRNMQLVLGATLALLESY